MIFFLLRSRNAYLNAEERKSSLVLSRSLFKSKELFESGEMNCSNLKDVIRKIMTAEDSVILDYIEIINPDELTEIATIEKRALVAIAARIGTTRLIDNIVLEVK